MTTIIAGMFETQPEADRAIEAAKGAGFGASYVTCFYLNPPGMHATYPIGGDTHHDAGTKQAGKTAAAGATVGGVAGLALGTVVGAVAEPGIAAMAAVAGAGVGAYVGSLAGGLSGTHAPNPAEASAEEPIERDAGVMVAMRTDSADEKKAIEILRTHGAHGIERASGAWVESATPAWNDFDPRKPPQYVDPSQARHAPPRA
jgi:hypothetical protein